MKKIRIGPVDLNDNLVSGTSVVPTVTGNLYSQGTINAEEIGVSFAPSGFWYLYFMQRGLQCAKS